MAEAKDNKVNEEPKILRITENVNDVDVEKQYLMDDISDEGKIIYNKLAVIQEQKMQILNNANFEVECKDILINHFMSKLKENLPEEMEAKDEDAKGGDNKKD